MRFRTHKPKFDEDAKEYCVPIWLSQDLVHQLLSGWAPFGLGYAHLRAREDKTFDIFLRGGSTLREDLNMVNLTAVQLELLAALDLALRVKDMEDELPDEMIDMANKVLEHLHVAVE